MSADQPLIEVHFDSGSGTFEASGRPSRASREAFLHRTVLHSFGPDAAATLTRLASGRPALAPPGPDHPATVRDIAAASTRGLMVAATALGGRLGLDIEHLDPLAFTPAMTEDAFTPGERRWIQLATDSHSRALRPLALWCAKEAVLKARGVGLSTHPRTVEVIEPDHLADWAEVRGDSTTWWAHARCHSASGRPIVLAVAIDAPGASIRIHDLAPA